MKDASWLVTHSPSWAYWCIILSLNMYVLYIYIYICIYIQKVQFRVNFTHAVIRIMSFNLPLQLQYSWLTAAWLSSPHIETFLHSCAKFTCLHVSSKALHHSPLLVFFCFFVLQIPHQLSHKFSSPQHEIFLLPKLLAAIIAIAVVVVAAVVATLIIKIFIALHLNSCCCR